MNEAGAARQIRLSEAQTSLASKGTFVRIDFGFFVRAEGGARFRSAFVANRGTSSAARWVAYANVCRHHPIELDASDPSTDRATGLRVALVAQDGAGLLCASHGAVYRPADGFCTTGPCFGQSLLAIDVVVDGDIVALVLPADSVASVAGAVKFT